MTYTNDALFFFVEVLTLLQWGPLAEGQLARPLHIRGKTVRSAAGEQPSGMRAESERIINRVEKLANQKGWTMAQVTLCWTLKRITSPIIGFSNVERLDDALAAVRGKTLSPEQEKYLEEPYTPVAVEGHF